jgi:hypothetical protein
MHTFLIWLHSHKGKTLASEKDLTDKIDLLTIVSSGANLKQRRIRIAV